MIRKTETEPSEQEMLESANAGAVESNRLGILLRELQQPTMETIWSTKEEWL